MEEQTIVESPPKLVEIIIKDPKKAGVFTFGPYEDKQTHEPRELKWENGGERTYKINGPAQPRTILDMNNKDDQLLYAHIKDHPTFADRNNPLIELRDLEKETNTALDHREKALGAQNVVKELNGTDLANFARLFGIPSNGVAEKTVKLALFELADKDPDRVNNEWESPAREVKELLNKGVERGIFAVDKSGIWRYGETVMGSSLDQAVFWLEDKENSDVLLIVRRDLDNI